MTHGFRRFVSPLGRRDRGRPACRHRVRAAGRAELDYPQTRKVDHVDTYHGVRVPDPYRWLEDDNSAETAAWVEAQNKVTFGYLERIPTARPSRRASSSSSTTLNTAPVAQGRALLLQQERRPAEPERPVHPEGPEGTPEVLIDPNTWSADGTTRLGAFSLSKDGKYAVVGISRAGSDWQEYGVMEVATKRMLPDKLEWIKVSGASWKGDGFFYSRYPAPAKGKELSSANENHQVYFHKVGTPQSADELVFRTGEPAAVPHGGHHGRRAVRHPERVGPRQGQEGQRAVRARPLEGRDGVQPLIGEIGDDSFGIIDNVGDRLLIETDRARRTAGWS